MNAPLVQLPPGLFVTATGTGCGKTFVTRGLARAWQRGGHRVAAIKPLETGCQPDPLDALALERAARTSGLAHAPGLYRAEPPLAPYAVSLTTATSPPDLHALTQEVCALASPVDRVLVEGAGGLLVPLDARHSVADLAAALRLPLLVIAPDALGVLSHTLTLTECARHAGLALAAIVLVRQTSHDPDGTAATNARILRARLACPVLAFPPCRDDDDALADAAEASGLTRLPIQNTERPAPAPNRF